MKPCFRCKAAPRHISPNGKKYPWCYTCLKANWTHTETKRLNGTLQKRKREEMSEHHQLLHDFKIQEATSRIQREEEYIRTKLQLHPDECAASRFDRLKQRFA